jgi:hypothetical protein
MPSYMQKEMTLLPDGIYSFECVAAAEKTSQNGNQKIELTHEVGPDRVKVYDNLTFTAASSWRIDAFRMATGEIIKGNIEASLEAEDCIGRKGQCSIVTETFNGRTRNRVDAYTLPNAPKPASQSAVPGASQSAAPPKFSAPNPNPNINEFGESDDIPF